MRRTRFRDRADAGWRLAERLRRYAHRPDVVVLGLPRGGVPVAFEIASALKAPLDVFVVRKLGAPGREEPAFGAIATGGVRVLDQELLGRLDLPAEWLEAIDAKERRELERRERTYRGDRPPPDLGGRTVILVDDGIVTGSTMLAAVRAVRLDDPARIVVAAPVADTEVCTALEEEADEVVCLVTLRSLRAVSVSYRAFAQTTDDEVRRLLERARHPKALRVRVPVRPLTGEAGDYDELVERAAGARYVLLGGASHGTREFYRERAEITKRLIAEAGFNAVAVEADWPDAYSVNLYVRGASDDADADGALKGFARFPSWMWRNVEVAEFVTLLRAWNDALPDDAPKVGFYGLDLYSLYTSIGAVVEFLEKIDPAAAARARHRYACFDQFGRDPQLYAYETGVAGAEPCEHHAVAQLLELHRLMAEADRRGIHVDADRVFYAEQNALLVADAEEYYRAMFRGGIESWNLRERHMAETLGALVEHLERTSGPTNVVVWAHNSHLGDVRATELAQTGEVNLGELVRSQAAPGDALLVGFTTYEGTVTAASEWGAPGERKRLRRALPGSWETLFHEEGVARFLLDSGALEGRRLERATGVVYRPEAERIAHYFHARLADQFDAVVHIDESTAVEPLGSAEGWRRGELPATYPFGV